MHGLCKEFTKPIPQSEILKPLWISQRVTTCIELKELAEIFCELQRDRHEADYNIGKRMTRDDAKVACLKAKEAMALWCLAEKRHPEVVSLFCTCLLLWPALGSR